MSNIYQIGDHGWIDLSTLVYANLESNNRRNLELVGQGWSMVLGEHVAATREQLTVLWEIVCQHFERKREIQKNIAGRRE